MLRIRAGMDEKKWGTQKSENMQKGADMEDIIILLILLPILGAAIYYIVKEKRKGNACIGCPMSGKCPRKNCGCAKKE